MNIRPRAARKAFKEVADKFRLQIAHQPVPHLCIDNGNGPTAEVNSGQPQRLVHRHHKISGSQDSEFVPQRLVKRLAQRNANVFHRVVLIDIQVALGIQPQIETPMPSKQLQHVIEEPYARRDLVLPSPIHIQ
jgi:hypothetical protein